MSGEDLVSTWLPVLGGLMLKSLIVFLIAGAALLALRRASASARHLVCLLTLTGLLALPLLSLALPGAGGSSFQSGVTRSNGIVVTHEEEMNPDTAGRRTVQAWFPLKQVQTDLRIGVALEPPPTGPTDPADVPKEWTEFPEVTLLPVR